MAILVGAAIQVIGPAPATDAGGGTPVAGGDTFGIIGAGLEAEAFGWASASTGCGVSQSLLPYSLGVVVLVGWVPGARVGAAGRLKTLSSRARSR
ncbi:hypothetical protein [Streptosporangium sp. NPDC000509]|uniref:hypothetical protein n=1 Tax=Streptosporangium sp. NPDC000509 TaxID=3366186 RepID=UPI0036821A10